MTYAPFSGAAPPSTRSPSPGPTASTSSSRSRPHANPSSVLPTAASATTRAAPESASIAAIRSRG
jgi:hypothetical protein